MRSEADYINAGKLGWARWQERMELAAREIPADLLPLWEREKVRFRKGSPERRVEAFLEYAEANRSEVLAAVIDDADAKLEAMIREYQGRPAPAEECPF